MILDNNVADGGTPLITWITGVTQLTASSFLRECGLSPIMISEN